MEYNQNHVLVAGFAQFPKGTPIFELYKVLGCILIIDKENDVIEDATFTFLADTTRNFISSIVKGKCIKNGIDDVIKEVEIRFIVPGQRAVVQSIIAAYERYCDYKSRHFLREGKTDIS
ncbi:flavorubredoxin [Caldalkalibacillus uzonensis]|uniref:Flavorubredoxin n=1 Tax=Caldalkalibacillus uzonensis TaxID=353224 RepID=A0ABU0CYI3_9BACI|nr:DUF3870 domain-containing protein [Caldalkalibacillus uzonensis]MDQ0341205.1 flavorubredoxin [Caldalkalibacillus uzonensis]